MSAGDTIAEFFANDAVEPATLYAPLNTIRDLASAPEHELWVRDYDTTQQQYLDFNIVLPAYYAGGNFDLDVLWTTLSVTGTVQWSVQSKVSIPGTTDLSAFAYGAGQNFSADTVPGTARIESLSSIAGVTAPNALKGRKLWLRLARIAPGGAAGKAELHSLELREAA